MNFTRSQNNKQCFILPPPLVCLLEPDSSIIKFQLVNSKPTTLILVNPESSLGFQLKVPPLVTLFLTTPYKLEIIAFKMAFVKNAAASTRLFLNFLVKLIVFATYGYYSVIQLIGFRYRQRWFRTSQVLRYRFGFNQKVWFKCPIDFVSFIHKQNPHKRTYYFFSFDFDSIRELTYFIHLTKPADKYKSRGVNLKEQPLLMKEGKKAIW